MPYPLAPWYLQGFALQTLQLLDTARSRQWVPPEFELISVLPGKTLGSVYVAQYKTGSSLEYNELIVVPALVRYLNTIGPWISHIYVDHPESIAGGREIWGLPKELAEFTWTGNTVEIAQGERLLCQLRYEKGWLSDVPQWPLPLGGTAFSCQEANVLSFEAKFQGGLGLLSSHLQVPTTSPFADLNLEQPWLTLEYQNLRLTVQSPSVIGQREIAYRVPQ